MARYAAPLTALLVGLALAGPPAAAQAPAGYAEAESRFAFLETERRVRLQTLLTAAGYWTGMPNVTFGRRLFDAVAQFQGENGFRPTGWLDGAQIARLRVLATPKLAQWGLRTIAHPFRPVSIWAPMGLGLTAERTARGLELKDPTRRLSLAYNYLQNVAVADAFAYTVEKFQREGATLHYKVLRPDFFAISASQDGIDIYMRYHQDGPGALGFVLRWDTRATDLSAERIAVLVSASLWSAMTPDAPFIPLPEIGAPDARAVALPPVQTAPPAVPSPPPAVAALPPATPPAAKPRDSSGTGFFVGGSGEVLTNAHVVEDCGRVEVRGPLGAVPAQVVARDAANDLAILRTGLTPPKVAALRMGIRLGEPVAAFGYPLAGVLSTSGNFTLGNVTALTGLGDNTSYLQVSAPVQPGNSGGPLLDGNGNFVGVVTAKLNALKVMVATNGDIPQNVNFALKGAVAATFLESNGVAFTAGSAAAPMAPADLADHAKAMSVSVTCR
ncbi:serine protease [Methylobacterium nonmethylotrophicum]|uniref:Peptidoglycan-binding protein n=1 Tax=Methylobacterium nonmethylotrophicum TaxID=1141884 RepID=A0A4Z0NTJ8_9HYPH|nr:serine protease [Methylobacterium nonmethylotrophicum]TGE00535.1 peptidoglycan-binding protein [Methylobacterium nonmethylotrophicum]